MMLKIEKSVPLPPRAGGRKPIYPFAQMKVGDSFFSPQSPARMSTIANYWSQKLGNGHRFTTRAEKNGTRVWRIA